MNERVMQFRIGMFVIVAGLVLTTMIIWFGESPSLFRDHVYVVVHYAEAPGVAEGIPVRKSGIRVGEVTSIAFDERPNQTDGVLVTLSLDRKYKIKAGSVPRLSRSLIGDVTIDLLPGSGPGTIPASDDLDAAPIIEGATAPDPAKALTAASEAFEKAGDTLASITDAAKGINKLTKDMGDIGVLSSTWIETGKKMTLAAEGIDGFMKANQDNIGPAITNLRDVAQKLNTTLDPATMTAFGNGVRQFDAASKRLDAGLVAAGPFLNDIGAPVTSSPKTDFGQTMRRMNKITGDISLLTQPLSDGKGNLNPNGSLQKFMTQPELYDNINKMAATANDAFSGAKTIMALFKVFAEKVARDPSLIGRGALRQ